MSLGANDFSTINEDKQNPFAQAVLMRSFDLNYMEIANKSREFLLHLSKPFLDIRCARVRGKEALKMTLEGHSFAVNSVAITTDNSKIVSGSSDNTILI